MSLSAEGQHLIDSLEAHYRAVKAIAEGQADEQLVKHVEGCHEAVLKAVEGWGKANVVGQPASTAVTMTGNTFDSSGWEAQAPASTPEVGS